MGDAQAGPAHADRVRAHEAVPGEGPRDALRLRASTSLNQSHAICKSRGDATGVRLLIPGGHWASSQTPMTKQERIPL